MLFFCLFVLIDQSGYCYFCSVMRSFCVLRDGQGIFFNIHIYIFWGGGRVSNTLQCSCEAVHPEMNLGCKAAVLPTVTNFNLTQVPLSNLPPGVQAELISGFHDNRRVRTSKQNKFSQRQTWLKKRKKKKKKKLSIFWFLVVVVVFPRKFQIHSGG